MSNYCPRCFVLVRCEYKLVNNAIIRTTKFLHDHDPFFKFRLSFQLMQDVKMIMLVSFRGFKMFKIKSVADNISNSKNHNLDSKDHISNSKNHNLGF